MEILGNRRMLGTALPGFRNCKPSWLRLSKETLAPYAIKKTKFICLAGAPPLPPLLHPAWPQVDDSLANGGQDSSREGQTKTGMVTKGPSGKDLGGYRKRGWWTLSPHLWHSLSPHSVCKNSPNLLAALLPLPDFSLKQWQKWVWPCAGKGQFPGGSGLRKNA